MENVHGTCSLCGGRVVSPMHTVRPVPHCESCGAVPVEAHGPIIPMRPGRVFKTHKPFPDWCGNHFGYRA